MAREETYQHLKVFDEVVSYITGKYVEPVNVDKVMRGGMRGLADGLDADSAYLSPQEVKQAESRVGSGCHSAAPSDPAHACRLTRSIRMLRPEPYAGRYRRPRSLPPRCADLVEAVAAIDGPAHGRGERNLGGLAAFGADHFVEFLGAPGAPNVAIDRPAVGTA